MPIEFNIIRNRKSVVWLAVVPPDDAKRVFEEREYKVEPCTDQDLHKSEFLEGLSAVVFTQRLDNLGKIAEDLQNHAQRLLNYDCNIVLRAAPGGLAVLIETINDLALPVVGVPLPEAKDLTWQAPAEGNPPAPYALYFDEAVAWHGIANLVMESPPGPAPNSNLKIKIEPRIGENGEDEEVTLSDESTLLVQRAFWDCSDVHLTPMEKGNSRVDVYRACPELTGGVHGQWPQPHFVKVGERPKILAEYKNYVLHVDPYVPFHLGPHLVRDRCCLGAKEGILVGDYVEEAEDLCDCAPEGRSSPAIACLFDRTLLGWHRRAHPATIPISQGLLDRFPKRMTNKARMEKVRELGATLDLDALRGLFKCCTSTPVLVGPIHGDLHSENVRVRTTDAIVIDFFQHRDDYPLVYDAACLEASLLIEGFANDKRSPQEWLESLKPLYETSLLDVGVTKANPKNPSFWFHASVHQIRRYARQWEFGANQYAGALAVALLIKAAKTPKASERESYRRAGAYLIAEKILSKAFGDQQQAQAGPQPQAPAPEVAS
jgi:hypothetical protein